MSKITEQSKINEKDTNQHNLNAMDDLNKPDISDAEFIDAINSTGIDVDDLMHKLSMDYPELASILANLPDDLKLKLLLELDKLMQAGNLTPEIVSNMIVDILATIDPKNNDLIAKILVNLSDSQKNQMLELLQNTSISKDDVKETIKSILLSFIEVEPATQVSGLLATSTAVSNNTFETPSFTMATKLTEDKIINSVNSSIGTTFSSVEDLFKQISGEHLSFSALRMILVLLYVMGVEMAQNKATEIQGKVEFAKDLSTYEQFSNELKTYVPSKINGTDSYDINVIIQDKCKDAAFKDRMKTVYGLDTEKLAAGDLSSEINKKITDFNAKIKYYGLKASALIDAFPDNNATKTWTADTSLSALSHATTDFNKNQSEFKTMDTRDQSDLQTHMKTTEALNAKIGEWNTSYSSMMRNQ